MLQGQSGHSVRYIIQKTHIIYLYTCQFYDYVCIYIHISFKHEESIKLSVFSLKPGSKLVQE